MKVKTLNKDFGLIQKSNGTYDLNFQVNDLVQLQNEESLANGIILSIMTGYRELLKTNNPTYANFGNRSYELIKANKNELVLFKIEQYFKECLKKIRRIKKINSVIVKDIPEGYAVTVRVTSITDELVNVDVQLAEISKLESFIQIKGDNICSIEKPLQLELYLHDELDNGLSEELLEIYIDNELFSQTPFTTEEGIVSFTFQPGIEQKTDIPLICVFKGNNEYTDCKSMVYYFDIVPPRIITITPAPIMYIDGDSIIGKLFDSEGTEVINLYENNNLIASTTVGINGEFRVIIPDIYDNLVTSSDYVCKFENEYATLESNQVTICHTTRLLDLILNCSIGEEYSSENCDNWMNIQEVMNYINGGSL